MKENIYWFQKTSRKENSKARETMKENAEKEEEKKKELSSEIKKHELEEKVI